MSTTPTAKKATSAGNAKRISALEEELADLKAQMAEVADLTSVVAQPAPVISAPPPTPASSNESVIKYLHDTELLRAGKIRPSNFKKRYAHFLETGKL